MSNPPSATWLIDQTAILALPAWKARAVRIALNRLVRLRVLMTVDIDYLAGCEAMQFDSHGWQTCGDEGDLESFTVGVNAALGQANDTT